MSICREQGQQGFVLDDDLVERNLHSTFSTSGEEKTERAVVAPGGLYGSGREFSWTRLHAVSLPYSLNRHG